MTSRASMEVWAGGAPSVLVLDADSPFALTVVRSLGRVPGMRVHLLAMAPAPPARASRYVRSFDTWPGGSDESFLEHVRAVVKRTAVDAVLPVDVSAIERVGRLTREISSFVPHTPVPPPSALAVAGDKLALAQFAVQHRIAHPRTVRYEGPASVDSLGFPVLLKPLSASNGLGIRLVATPDALPTALPGPTLAQEYLRGRDIDCSVLCDRGRIAAHTIQRSIIEPSRPFGPANGVEFIRDDRVLRLVASLMGALEWHGIAHIDLRYRDDDELFVIEINPRFWGSLEGSRRAGVNFPYLAWLSALGRALPALSARPGRFVGGSGAMKAWRMGHIGRDRAGFSYRETVFPTLQADPLPLLFEAGQLTQWRLTRVLRRLRALTTARRSPASTPR